MRGRLNILLRNGISSVYSSTVNIIADSGRENLFINNLHSKSFFLRIVFHSSFLGDRDVTIIRSQSLGEDEYFATLPNTKE
jgi:hypothetical protein